MRGLVAQMPVVGSLVADTERGRPAAKAALPALAVLLLAVPFIAMGLDGFDRPPASLITLRTLALVAFTLLFIDVVVGAFRPLFTRVYKARPLQRAHAVIGGSAFVLALGHGILMLNLGITGYPWQVKIGLVVLALLFVVIATALNRKRLRLVWRWIHRLNYVLFGLIIGHAFALGYNLATQPFMKVIFLVYAAVAAIGFGYRLVPARRGGRRRPGPRELTDYLFSSASRRSTSTSSARSSRPVELGVQRRRRHFGHAGRPGLLPPDPAPRNARARWSGR